jgi:hypothetical protein
MQTRDKIVERLQAWMESALIDVIHCWTSSLLSHTDSISSLESRLNDLDMHLSRYLRRQAEDCTERYGL